MRSNPRHNTYILATKGLKHALLAGILMILAGPAQGQVVPRLDWGTYHGGDQGEAFRDLYTDKLGNTYVIGSTTSPAGISTPGSYQPMPGGGPDVFLAKYSPSGTRLWATYFGGPAADQGQHVTMDTIGGFLYVTGFSSSASGIATGGVHQSALLGPSDAFLAKFDTTGALIWSTYFGGSEGETCNAVAVDGDGNATIIGWTNSSDNIASPGAHQPIFRGQQDIFIAQFDPNGFRRWSTYYGDIGFDIGLQVAVTPTNDIILSGWTSSVINIVSPGAYQIIYAGGTSDAILMKFSQNGTRIWSTYFGGTQEEYGDALYLDGSGDIFLAGPCTSPDGLATAGTHQPAIGGNFDGYVARFDANGNRIWGTYYGGPDIDVIYGITGSPDGSIMITGHSRSMTAIATTGTHQPTSGGNWDAFLARFDPMDGQRIWGTYYGGSQDDQSFGVACDSAGFIYMTGFSFSPDRISTAGASQETSAGDDDGFVARFAPCTEPEVTLVNGGYLCSGADIVLDLEFTGEAPFIVEWSIDGVNQPPITSDTTTLFFTVDGNLWTDSITILGVSSGPCRGLVLGPRPFVHALEPVSATNVTIDCNQADQTYTVSGNLSGGFAAYLDAGNTSVVINLDAFTSAPLPFATPYDIGITSGLMCDTVFLQGMSGCMLICPENFGTIRPDTTVCNGDDLPLYASGGASYAWTGPDNFTSNLQAPVITGMDEINEGVYTVIIRDNNGCPDTITTLVTVHTVNGNINPDQSVCFGDTIRLSASGGTAYLWSGPNGFSGMASDTFLANAAAGMSGLYSVSITDGTGCSTTLSTNVAVVAPPVVMIGSNSPVCEGATLQLAASGGTVYSWSGPGGFTGNADAVSRPDVSMADAGIYSVSVSDGSSCFTTATVDVQVLVGPSLNITSNEPLCTGQDLELTASGADQYEWSGPDAFTSLLANPVLPAVDISATGTYTLIGILANGCRDTTTLDVTVHPLPPAIVSQHPAPYCEGDDIQLSVSPAATYAWTGPGGFTSSQQAPVIPNISLSQQGVYDVTVTDSNGCTNEGSSTINIDVAPQVQIISAAAFCSGGTLVLEASGDPAVHTWSGPGGFAANGLLVSIDPVNATNAGTYWVTAVNVSGCEAHDSIVIVVDLPVTGSISGPDEICLGESIVLTAAGGTGYTWGTGMTGPTFSDTPTATSAYDVTVTQGACADTVDWMVLVKPLPVILVTAPGLIDIGSSATLSVTGADQYAWSPATGLSCTNCPNPIASPQETTVYCVTGETDGCTTDTCITLTVREECDLVLPNVFSPNFDGINDTWCSPLLPCAEEQSLQVYDRWGDLIFQAAGATVCWDGSSGDKQANPGVYVFVLELRRAGKESQYLQGDITLLR